MDTDHSQQLRNKKKFVRALTLKSRSKYAIDNFLKPVNLKTSTLKHSKKTANSLKFRKSRVPEATIEESVIPEATIEESVIPEATIEESVIPEATIEESVIPEATIEESVILDSQNDADLHVRDNMNISTNIDPITEINERQRYSNNLRRIISLLGIERQKQKNNVPDWAKLAIANINPTKNTRIHPPSETLKQQQVIRSKVAS